MELAQLRALRELGERGSIAAVAAALLVTPSSVSQQISALQRNSPVPLTYRVGRRTALTDAGRALAAAVVDVEVALARAENAVKRFQAGSSAGVSVTAFQSAALAFFGPLASGSESLSLHDFDVAQPDFPRLTAEYDLVIAHRLIGSPPWPSTIRVEPLLFEPLDIAVSRGHRLARRKMITPEDLRDESWVTVHEHFPLAGAVTLIAATAGREPDIRHRVNDFSVAATLVAATDSVALLPRYLNDLNNHPDVILRPLSNPQVGRQIDCLARPETLERSSVRQVLANLRRLARDVLATEPPHRDGGEHQGIDERGQH